MSIDNLLIFQCNEIHIRQNTGTNRHNAEHTHMSVTLSSEAAKFFKDAREKIGWTESEVAAATSLSIRTIRNIENRTKKSFRLQTLEILHNFYVRELENFPAEKQLRPWDVHAERKANVLRISVLIGLGAFLLVVAILWMSFAKKPVTSDGEPRTDYVDETQQMTPIPERNPADVGNEGVHANYIHVGLDALRDLPRQVMRAGETVPVEIKWSYNYYSPPEYHISLYTEWEPDTEFPVFSGVLAGKDSKTGSVVITAPQEVGKYRIRVFFASSYGPVGSFYGGPGPNQVTAPSTAPYCELNIEVVADE